LSRSRALLIAVAAFAAIVLVAALVIRPRDAAGSTVLQRPAAGEVRPDYLDDGTPVWVIGQEDGSVTVLSGFDTHRPFNLGKVLWWCETSGSLHNPDHGARYDTHGVHIDGPALTDLPAYEVTVSGDEVTVGELGEPPAPEAVTAPARGEGCTVPGDRITYHTFEGWPTWDSPTDAVEAAPDGWILLDGQLVLDGGEAWLCARDGCDDRVFAGIEAPTDPQMEFGPLMGDRFIAQVRDGELVGLTRVLPAELPSE
jgi:hypothetical protein